MDELHTELSLYLDYYIIYRKTVQEYVIGHASYHEELEPKLHKLLTKAYNQGKEDGYEGPC